MSFWSLIDEGMGAESAAGLLQQQLLGFDREADWPSRGDPSKAHNSRLERATKRAGSPFGLLPGITDDSDEPEERGPAKAAARVAKKKK